MHKTEYAKPEMEVIRFEETDIITTSSDWGKGDYDTDPDVN